MKILVTGGTGFVGRVVVQFLAEAGHALRLALRSATASFPHEQIVVGDITSETDWRLPLDGVDAVLHLAARVHVMRDHASGSEDFTRTNADATLRLARAAAYAGARRFVFVSTIKVNGEATFGTPFRAEDEPSPQDAYARSKAAAERGLRELTGIESVIIRPPLVHGPGARGNLAKLCRLARSGIPVPLAGIQNRRDLVGVVNLASVLERSLFHPAAAGETFLVSDGEALSTPRLYQLIAEAMGRPARMFDVPVGLLCAVARPLGLAAEVDRLSQSLELEIAKTRRLLDWTPPLSAAAGIASMARAYLGGPA